jgi:hypothetical protein
MFNVQYTSINISASTFNRVSVCHHSPKYSSLLKRYSESTDRPFLAFRRTYMSSSGSSNQKTVEVLGNEDAKGQCGWRATGVVVIWIGRALGVLAWLLVAQAGVHSITSQKTWIFSNTAVESQNSHLLIYILQAHRSHEIYLVLYWYR